ncbi:HTH_Tnp_Tc3_2 domain-containing protein [Trichonephila clavipes]|nr:HTH_Tnp_Tc3_2 domain-containing protein [Trichonephila clavipes]
MDHVILSHGQGTWTTPELAPPLLTTTPHQREDVSALDRFVVHRCPSQRIFGGTVLELVTKPVTIQYLYHSATAAIIVSVEDGLSLGLMIRGGAEYGLGIYITGVDESSAADLAGLQRQDGSGHPRVTSDRDDRFIALSAVTTPDSSLSTIRRVTRTPISIMAIHRRLIERNLCYYRLLRQLPLTPAHCRARLLWCLARSGWNHTDWGRIVFSNESRFQLCPDDHRRCVWRRPGQHTDPAFTVARRTVP